MGDDFAESDTRQRRPTISTIMIVVRFVDALGTNGMIDESTTLDPETLVINPIPGRSSLRYDQHLYLASRKTLMVGLLPPISGAKEL